MGMQVSVNGQMQLQVALRSRLLFNVTSLILATTSYYSRLIEHEKIEINYKPPPFYSYFRPEEETKNAKKWITSLEIECKNCLSVSKKFEEKLHKCLRIIFGLRIVSQKVKYLSNLT